MNILLDDLRIAPPISMIYKELLPLPVYRIACVNIFYNNLLVASPTCMMDLELFTLFVELHL